MTATAGAVLAGGGSRRMGRDKAAILVDGVPMAVRVAQALEAGGCDPVVTVGGRAVTGFATVPDLYPGEGPLGGVITALRHLGADAVVAACDLPDVDGATIALVARPPASGSTVRVARTDRLQPQCARWPAALLPVLEDVFAAGERSLRGVLAIVDLEEVVVGRDALVDLDTPVDLERRAGDADRAARVRGDVADPHS